MYEVIALCTEISDIVDYEHVHVRKMLFISALVSLFISSSFSNDLSCIDSLEKNVDFFHLKKNGLIESSHYFYA